MSMNTAKRKYVARFWPVMTVYVIAVIAVSWAFNDAPPDGALSYVLAALPALPIVGVFYVMGRYLIEETDEFVRLQQTIAVLIGVAITLSFCAVYGFLEIYAAAPKIGLFNVVWGFFLSFGIGSAVMKWWYR